MGGVILWSSVLLITLFALYFFFHKRRREVVEKTIPGPPLIEGLITCVKGILSNTLHLSLVEWAEKYGDVMQINLLVKQLIVINDADTYRRLVKDRNLRDFTNDRPPTFYAEYMNNGDKDIVMAPYGPNLHKRRKIFHNILKFYGESKDQLEEIMVSSLTELTKTVKKMETIDISAFINNYILNLINFLLLGKVCVASQQNLKILEDLSVGLSDLFPFEIDTPLHAFPFLRFVPGLRFKRLYDAACAAKKRFHDTFFYPVKESFDPTETLGMVEKMLSLQMEGDTGTLLDDDTIKAIMQDVVGAGYITSSSVLTSLFLYLIKLPEVQDRVYQEINKIIGVTSPSSKHREYMPYTESVILETMRISSNLPLLVPHTAMEDVVFDGYNIPKSSTLIMNAWYNHHRPDFWEKPSDFTPERFLDRNGQLLQLDHPVRQKLIPFGTGRRKCPGETFAKTRIFLVTTVLLQRFQFLPDHREPLPSLNPADWVITSTLFPGHYKCQIKSRK